MPQPDSIDFSILSQQMDGELFTDDLMKRIYATDASIYRKIPQAVAYPKHNQDINALITFSNKHKLSLIPRTAGTSLAGQCVGEGIVVDVSKYFTKIIDLDIKNRLVQVQPGVIRDELNDFLEPYGLFFSPNTSTSNRCMIGGMVGNNSSGSTSIKYGVTRDKVIQLKTILSDGSEVVFNDLDSIAFKEKMTLTTLEGTIYNAIYDELSTKEVQEEIMRQFPKPEIHRRNTGYAIDELIRSTVFSVDNRPFNMCQLLCGSEGTLAFTTEITLKLDVLPPMHSVIVALHFHTIMDCMNAVKPAMQYDLYTCEMMDRTILDLTKHNKSQEANRFFVEGNPEAILLCELKSNTIDDLQKQQDEFLKMVKSLGLSYANPVLKDDAIQSAFELRKAGLGLLGNMVGDKKTVACIEDTAVSLDELSSYITDFSKLMESYHQSPIYYAHAGAGELHLRPILNLKDSNDVKLLKSITSDVAALVKKYGGSMSGEHGDGIVRSSFIPQMIGEKNYNILRRIKKAFDPHAIFNPGKIIDPYPIDKNLRYDPGRSELEIKTLMDFSSSQGILRESEKCNGSGDCRKLPQFGGTMCPSYHATKNEKDTTRARANALREILTNSKRSNPFDSEDLKTAFDLCLSCKACTTECPSSVDVASLKAEFQYQYQEINGYSFRNRFFANAANYNKMAAGVYGFSNWVFQNPLVSSFIKKTIGIHPKRSLPKITRPFSKIDSDSTVLNKEKIIKTVYLFIDEFTNYLESQIALDAKQLLEALHYEVICIDHLQSGRAQLSKGFLREAKTICNTNLSYLKDIISNETPLLGIEPSAILSFRDDYVRLANDKDLAKELSKHVFLIEEFLQSEIQLGNIKNHVFTDEAKTIKFHGHCYQKALSNTKTSFDVLNLPKNYNVSIIASGCCGMAGSFGYEKEHFDISMTIGEQRLFPSIRNSKSDILIAANGSSCRHQIKDGTNRIALHPISILKHALK